MRKLITTEMLPDRVSILITVTPDEGGDPVESVNLSFPMSLINPRVSLQIATLLVSDPTIPQCHDKEEDK